MGEADKEILRNIVTAFYKASDAGPEAYYTAWDSLFLFAISDICKEVSDPRIVTDHVEKLI